MLSILRVRRRRLAGLCLLLLATGPAAGARTIALPSLGNDFETVLSPAQERRLGEDAMRQVRRSLAFVEDPEINGYIQSLGERLVAHADTTQRHFRFFVIDNPTINSFAMPGGFIGVHTALILATQNESELAAVLSHEISHVTQHHIARLMLAAKHTTVPAMAALLASVLLASSGSASGIAGMALTSAAVAQREITYSRSFEEEADRIGMQLLARSGFDPRAMPEFFERMQELNRYNGTDLPPLLRDHPVTTNRIADALNRAAQYPVRHVPSSAEYYNVRAKIRALTADDPDEAARAFAANLADGKYRNIDAERYGYVLALVRADHLVRARAEAARLVADRPGWPMYRVAQADVELATRDYSRALAEYANINARHPHNLMLREYYAGALLRTNHPHRARALLRSLVRARPQESHLYKMLAEASGNAGFPLEAHRAMAEYDYQNGDPGAALEQLRLAKRLAGNNFYLQSSLDARIRAIREGMAAARAR